MSDDSPLSAQISGLDSAIQAFNDQNARIGVSTHSKLNSLITELQALTDAQQAAQLDLKSIVITINATIAAARRASRNEKIIASLWFHVLKDRHDTIDTAYQKTLRWLFDSKRTTLSRWLRNGEGIYWINGLVCTRIWRTIRALLMLHRLAVANRP